MGSEPKVTDSLYLCHEMASMQANFSGPLGTIRERFVGIERELGVRCNIGQAVDELGQRLAEGTTDSYVASRGEAFNGRLVAAFLGAEFVDPYDCVEITGSGRVGPETYERLAAWLADESKVYVMPGFYGRGPHGEVKTFSRGGSDISGAIAARFIGAELYENWTDVPGLLMADPRIVDNPRPMSEVTYREIRELSYMGAAVLHDEAILPVREAGIPICIKNTNEPDHPGTRIVTKLSTHEEKNTEIAGVAGKKGFAMIAVEKSLMNTEIGFAYRLLGVFERRGSASSIALEHRRHERHRREQEPGRRHRRHR